jgi:hypothetical protein
LNKENEMIKAVISIPVAKDKNFYLKLFRKMGIKIRFLNDGEKKISTLEDILIGKMIEEGKTGEAVSKKEVFKALEKNGS